MRQITAYQTDDGRVFEQEDQALEYEQHQQLRKLIESRLHPKDIDLGEVHEFITNYFPSIKRILDKPTDWEPPTDRTAGYECYATIRVRWDGDSLNPQYLRWQIIDPHLLIEALAVKWEPIK